MSIQLRQMCYFKQIDYMIAVWQNLFLFMMT